MVTPMNYDASESLKGKFLISSPVMPDNRFYQAVVLITNHTDAGASGLIINKISAHKFVHIAKHVGSNYDENSLDTGKQQINIVLGGPIHPNNLFVIHTIDYSNKDTLLITDNIGMTNNVQIISDLSHNRGPQKSVISMGCATWQQGQLEKELYTDSWLIYDLDKELLFGDNTSNMYNALFSKIGLHDFESNSALYSSSKVRS